MANNRSPLNSLKYPYGSQFLKINFPPEFESLFAQPRDFEQNIANYQKILTTKPDYIFCPVCSNGYLHPAVAGKIAGVLKDYWLIYNNCNAKFDKQLNRARIIKVQSDPRHL